MTDGTPNRDAREALGQARGALALAAQHLDRGEIPPSSVRRILRQTLQVWALHDDTTAPVTAEEIAARLGPPPLGVAS